MATDHFATILNQQIELCMYSEGGVTWSDTENMSADEFMYVIHNFKRFYEEKQKARQDFIKSIMEWANKGIESLFKLLSKLGGSR
jgi:hypothetical protein